MENIPEIIIVSDSKSDVEVENADDTKNTGIENSNGSNSSVFGEHEKLPIDSIYVTESDDKGEKCKKFNEPPQHEEEAGVDKDNMNTNDQDMNISGDNDNILCKEPPITESIVISSDDEKSTIPEVGFYIHPRLIKTFDFEYSRTTSRPGPKSRTRKKLEIQEMYFQILNAGVNPKNGHRLSRYLQKQPCVSPKTKINMASKSGVKSNLTINIESDDNNCPRSSTQSIFLDTEGGFYIHPRLIKTFDFEYSRTTSRPGPKSKTRKKLEIQEMYFQILNAGVNPKNGHRLSRYLQKQPCVSPKTKINMASKSGIKSNLTINIESDDNNCPRSSTQSIFLDTDHGTASTSSNSATVTCLSGNTSVSGFLSSDLKSSANIISPCNATSTATSIEHESMDVNTDCIVKTETEKENSIDTNSDCVGEVVKSEY